MDLNELKIHYQFNHMSVKVNVIPEEQTVLICSHCDFKCKPNIQINNHIMYGLFIHPPTKSKSPRWLTILLQPYRCFSSKYPECGLILGADKN